MPNTMQSNISLQIQLFFGLQARMAYFSDEPQTKKHKLYCKTSLHLTINCHLLIASGKQVTIP